jgi:exosortase D (VPLPA-CTERM-specific)
VLLARRRHHDLVGLRERQARRLAAAAWLAFAAGVALLVLGTAAAEHWTSRISGVLVGIGLCGILGGPTRLRRYGPPLALLAFMVPLPYVLYYRMAFPLQLLSAQLASGALALLGLDVSRSGNLIDLDGHVLEVVRSCSGIRSIMALATLAATLVVAMRLRPWRGAALLLASAPAALAGNTLRLVTTALLVRRFGPGAAEGHVHDATGLAAFAVSLALLGLAARVLRRSEPPAAPSPGTVHRGPRFEVLRALAWFRTLRVVSLRAAWAALAVLAAAGAWAALLRIAPVPSGPMPRLEALPVDLPALRGRDIVLDDRVVERVQPDSWLFRSYAAAAGPDLALYVGYYRDPREGAQIHSPMHCYPGSGWKIERSEPIQVRDLNGRVSEMRRLLVEKQGRTDIVLFWYETRTRRLTTDLELKLELMRTALLRRPRDAAFVRWSTPMGAGETVEDATTRLLAATAQALPHLEGALPFGG